MKTEWIVDLLVLAQVRNFSRAAAMRNITQPAFSRRIRMLEQWLGVRLVDRSTQPLSLTQAAQNRLHEFRDLLSNLNRLRTGIRDDAEHDTRIVLSTQHSLTMSHLPPLIELLAQDEQLRIRLTVHSENRDECVDLFLRGQADLLLCMEEPGNQIGAILPQVVRLPMGYETLVPVSAVGPGGRPLFGVPVRGQRPLRLLAFPDGTFLGRILYHQCLDALIQRTAIEIVHESVFLAGIKEMVLAGLGLGWLPSSLVRRELESGALVVPDLGLAQIRLMLGLYHHANPAHAAAIQRIWELLSNVTHAG